MIWARVLRWPFEALRGRPSRREGDVSGDRTRPAPSGALNRLGGQRLLWAATVIWVLWLFGGCLLGHQRLAFRDVSHFYLPLYGYLGERLAVDGVPLWNPLDRFGIPVAGEATTAIFYPPRLLFSIGLPSDYAMSLYVVGHLLLAGAGARWAARRSGAGALGSLAAAVCYPASGSVFFLYTNPPFLVGAAWLPWITAALLIAINHPSSATPTGRRSFLAALAVASVALAMAVLGGDPQTAFHAVLFLAGYWLWRWMGGMWRQRGRAAPALASLPCPRLTPLLVCVLFAAGLSSLQIFAGLAWSQKSWRQQTQPPNVYQWIASSVFGDEPPSDLAAAYAATPAHRENVYDFSIAPWHWGELASPFLSGRLFPTNGRLSMLIPGEPRMWTLTLYAGLLPLLCLLAGPRRLRQWTVWHALVVVGLLMALGEFGIVKSLRVGLGTIGLTLPGALHDAVGGGYWGLVTFLPGYGQFRYPAKWLPFAALGMAVWTAIFLSRYDHRDRHRLVRAAGWTAAVAVGLWVTVWLPGVERSLTVLTDEANLSDRFWGPLDASDGLRTLRFSLSITALLAGSYMLLFAAGSWRERAWWRGRIARGSAPEHAAPRARGAREEAAIGGWRPAVAVLILIGDLIVATSWQLAVVERPLPDDVAALERAERSDADSLRFPRRHLSLASPSMWPPAWRTSAANDRLERVEAAQRETWFGRWHLADSAAVGNSSVSLGSARSELFWNEARRYADGLPAEERREFLQSLCRFMAAEATYARRSAPSVSGSAEQVRLVRTPVAQPLPMVRWHRDWKLGDASDFRSLAERMRDLMASIDRTQGNPVPRVERREIELAVRPTPSGGGSEGAPHVIELLEWQPERIRMRLEADAAGLVTVQQLQDGFWKARSRAAAEAPWIDLPVHRVDGIAQGVFVPAGEHEIEFRYRPTWLFAGMLTTAATILAFLSLCWWQWRKLAIQA